MPHPVIGLIANPTKPAAAELTKVLRDLFQQGGGRVLVEESTAGLAGIEEGMNFVELAAKVEVIVVLGGDGTILRTARTLGAGVKPLAAVNIGRLGFLTVATTGEIEQFVRAILFRDYYISSRRTLEAVFTLGDGRVMQQTALNEAVVSRGAISHMVRLDVRVDGDFLNCYSGDGLIVATPTGSTAYSLSAGGPIINPEAHVFCVTPVCPHAVSNRALVINDDATIVLLPTDSCDELLLSIDGGETWPLCMGQPVTLRRGKWDVPLVTLQGSSFYHTVRQKFQWTGSSV